MARPFQYLPEIHGYSVDSLYLVMKIPTGDNMNHMKIFMSQSGFSLVQGMMLAGVVAGSSLVATKLMSDQKLSQKSAETRDQVEQLHKMVYSTLQDKDSCSRTMFDGNFTPGAWTLGKVASDWTLKPSITQIVGKTGVPVAVSGNAYMNNNVMLNSIAFVYDNAALGKGTLTFRYQRMNQNAAGTVRLKNGYGAKDIQKKVVIRIQRDPMLGTPANRPFTGCYTVTSDSDGANGEDGNEDLNKTMCLQLNSQGNAGAGQSFFDWDDATSTCKPRDNTCKQQGYVNTGINSNGQAECRPIQDWMDTSNVIDQNSVQACPAGQNVTVQFISGKIKIGCAP